MKKATRNRASAHSTRMKAVRSYNGGENASLERFLATSPHLRRASLRHATLEQHWIGNPIFEDGETVESLDEASAVERTLVAVERREIDDLRSEYHLRDRGQREQLLRGLIHRFSPRELRISSSSFGEYLKRLDERDLGVSYFVPSGGKWRRATARETSRCVGMSDDEDAPFWSELFVLPRWAAYPATLTLSSEGKSRKAEPVTHDVELDTRAVARRIGSVLAQALGVKAPELDRSMGKEDWTVRIVWPRATRRTKGFSARDQHED